MKKNIEKDVGGRPTKYKKEYDKQAYKLCLLGATDVEIADFFNVCEATVNYWKKDHPSFLESLKSGKIKSDAEVAASLYKRANGYEYDEITKELKSTRNEDGTAIEALRTTKVVTKQVAPDTGAAFIWLKNRQPKQWRDKQEIEHSGGIDSNITTMSKEERNKRIEELKNKLGD